MQIMGISQSTPISYGSKARINQLDGSTLRFEMKRNPKNRKYTDIFGDVMYKNKTLQKFKYTCQNDEDIAAVFDKFLEKAEDSEEASCRMFDYMLKNMGSLPKNIDFDV